MSGYRLALEGLAFPERLGVLGVTAPGHGVVSLFLQVPPPAQRGDQDLCSGAALCGRHDGRERPLADEELHVCGDAGDHAEPHQLPEAVPLRPRAHGPAAGALLPAGGRGL